VNPFKKRNIHETKLQTKLKEHFRAVTKYLDEAQKKIVYILTN